MIYDERNIRHRNTHVSLCGCGRWWVGGGREWEVRDYDTGGQHRYTSSDLPSLLILCYAPAKTLAATANTSSSLKTPFETQSLQTLQSIQNKWRPQLQRFGELVGLNCVSTPGTMMMGALCLSGGGTNRGTNGHQWAPTEDTEC